MKRIKISIIAVIAIVMGIASSAFTMQNDNKTDLANSYFYQYTSGSTSQTDIEDIANYERSNLNCQTGSHVCGVFLSTDQPLGEEPDASEFDAVKSSLWASETNHSAANSSIKMKN